MDWDARKQMIRTLQDAVPADGDGVFFNRQVELRALLERLTVPPRCATVIIGPNNCGKSKLLRRLNEMWESNYELAAMSPMFYFDMQENVWSTPQEAAAYLQEEFWIWASAFKEWAQNVKQGMGDKVGAMDAAMDDKKVMVDDLEKVMAGFSTLIDRCQVNPIVIFDNIGRSRLNWEVNWKIETLFGYFNSMNNKVSLLLGSCDDFFKEWLGGMDWNAFGVGYFSEAEARRFFSDHSIKVFGGRLQAGFQNSDSDWQDIYAVCGGSPVLLNRCASVAALNALTWKQAASAVMMTKVLNVETGLSATKSSLGFSAEKYGMICERLVKSGFVHVNHVLAEIYNGVETEFREEMRAMLSGNFIHVRYVTAETCYGDVSLADIPDAGDGVEIVMGCSPAHVPAMKEVPGGLHQIVASWGLPRRPGFGSFGTKVTVRTNHFLVKISGNGIFHYHVNIEPALKIKRLNREIITKALNDGRFGGRLPAYDGQNSLYTAGTLSANSLTFPVVLSEDNRDRKFKVTIQLVNRLNLSGRQSDLPHEVIKAFDIVLRGTAAQRYSAVGRSFFSRDFGCQPLGSGLESWNGYFQSVRPTQSGLCLNIDLSTTAFLEELSVDKYVAEILGRRLDENILISDADLKKIKRRLQGLNIEVTHRGPIKHTYKVHDLSPEPARNTCFQQRDGKMVSIEAYFLDTYNYAIRFPFLPCLQVGNQKRLSYLPMEVCKIAPRQRYPGVSKFKPLHPDERQRKLVERLQGSGFRADPYSKEFGVSVDTNFSVVEARVLPSPELKYSGNGPCTKPQLGRWDMRNKKLVNGGQVGRWTCVNFTRHPKLAEGFCYLLMRSCVGLGMSFSPYPVAQPVNARPEAVETSIVQLCSKQPLELLIVILPDNNPSVYSDVKRVCETELGILSQCCLESNALRMSPQTLENIALKINAKVGGRNTVLMDAIRKTIPVISDNLTIVFGADVNHPSGPGDTAPSIAAVVASLDWPEVTKYAAVLRAQAGRKEVIEMAGMIRELLLRFYNSTGRKPERLIFYRDGVSEGQFDEVSRSELDAIFQACASLEREYKPTVTFVVVQKRHHTRLFPNDANKLKNGNILPGTVVDSKICQPHDFDFYLCSHASIKGTSRPAHYHVLHDENNFTADGLQKLTNDLCYTYACSTTAISYVSPAYYAHLAAFRARHYLSNELSSGTSSGGTTAQELPALCEALKSRMFYC